MPDIGQRAPAFCALDQNGQVVSSADLAGQPIVLYFYPKDNTPGCTLQARGLRDEIAEFESLGARVIGVSRDSVQSHERFCAAQKLPFTLLADTDGAICSAYGVLGEKTLFGRTVSGIIRTTFVIDAEGVIRAKFPGVSVRGHSAVVLEAVRSLAN